jgi:hypothetical protein
LNAFFPISHISGIQCRCAGGISVVLPIYAHNFGMPKRPSCRSGMPASQDLHLCWPHSPIPASAEGVSLLGTGKSRPCCQSTQGIHSLPGGAFELGCTTHVAYRKSDSPHIARLHGNVTQLTQTLASHHRSGPEPTALLSPAAPLPSSYAMRPCLVFHCLQRSMILRLHFSMT